MIHHVTRFQLCLSLATAVAKKEDQMQHLNSLLDDVPTYKKNTTLIDHFLLNLHV